MILNAYNEMWQRFTIASKRNRYELDPFLLDLENDTRRGITALAYLKQGNSTVLNEIVSFQGAVQEIEPNQYYHPPDELHLTILSIISCISEFELNEIKVSSYIEIFTEVLRSTEQIEIKYQGVSASPNCIVIQGFPVNDAFERLRNELKTKLKKAGLRETIESRYKLVTAHSSIIRFKNPISDGRQLFALCQRYRNHNFGSIVLNEFELVFNNWYQNLDVTQSLVTCSV